MKQIFALLMSCWLFIQCFSFSQNKDNTFQISIKNPDREQHFSIPLKCDEWCIRRGKVIKNTTNDTIKIWNKFFLPGSTGTFLSMECYACPGESFDYIPYKATKGEIVIEWSRTPD
jgi:hypothetical protein